MNVDLRLILTPLAAFLAAVVLTATVRGLARRFGVVARPRSDRWHKKPTALCGGVGIYLAVLGTCLAACPMTPDVLAVLLASSLLFVVGLVDDFLHLKPYQKLIGQILGAALIIAAGLSLPWTSWPLVNMGITLLWLVGITNAINLLDNMDGLAAGIAVTAAVFLAICFATNGQMTELLVLSVFAAALLGFLVFNFNPASIFMGDCGSMFIGFFLASSALMTPMPGGRSRSMLPVLAVPILVLCIPIFDTTLVTILRKLVGRPASQGGRDHTSHRLVALGMTERRAVLLLYGLAAASGVLALLVRHLDLELSLTAILGFTLALTLMGVYLAKVKVYSEAEVRNASSKPLIALLLDLTHKRHIFEVLLDVALIVLAYHGANMLLFGTRDWEHWTQAACVLVAVKLASFALVGIYRSIWRYVSVADLLLFARASVLGTLIGSLFLYLAYGELVLELMLLDSLLLFVLLASSRLTFRVLAEVLSPPACRTGRRVLIYGAGDAGELLLRELLNNVALSCTPVGFADDDPLKQGKVIHGLRVFGGHGHLQRICEEQRVDEVYLSSTHFNVERVTEIRSICQAINLPLKQMWIRLEEVNLAVYAQDAVEVFGVARHHLPIPAAGLAADLRVK